MPRIENPTAPAGPLAPVAAVVSGALMSCTVWLGPNSMPVVSGSAVVVRAGTQSGPVTVESVWVIVLPTAAGAPEIDAVVDAVVSVAIVVPLGVVPLGVVPVAVAPVVDAGVVVAVGVVVAATPAPARLIAAPHDAAAPVFVTSTSVTIRVCPAGTVNAVTAVVPLGTVRVISTTLSTTGVPVVDGDALGVAAGVVLVVVAPVVVVPPVVVPVVVVVDGVVVCAVVVVVSVGGVSVVGGTGVDVVSVVVWADN
jgi:hypothetical protein